MIEAEYLHIIALFVIALVLIWGFGPLRKQAAYTVAAMKNAEVSEESMQVSTPARLY